MQMNRIEHDLWVRAVDELCRACPFTACPGQEKCVRLAERIVEMKEELYEENQSLVWFTLKKYFPSLKVDEDVLQVCRIGLWQACAEYYPEKGAKFSTFAVKGIFMAVRRYIRDCCKPQIAALPLDDFVSPNSRLLVEETVGKEDEHPALEDMMKRLTPTQRLMVTMRSAELSVYDIGDALGCTPQYVSQELGRARKTIERFIG